MQSISWNPAQNQHMTMGDVERILTAEHVMWLASQPHGLMVAACRAEGAWTANDREMFAAYTRYVELMR